MFKRREGSFFTKSSFPASGLDGMMKLVAFWIALTCLRLSLEDSLRRGKLADLSKQEITGILEAWNLGQSEALQALVPLVYGELRRLARSYMRGERAGHTLETDALVHEAFIRLRDLNKITWKDRNHFLAISARIMRRVLIDSARARKAGKRGGDYERITLDQEGLYSSNPQKDLLRLDEALEKLSTLDERKSRVVELRFFGGLSVKETAEILGISVATAMRDWEFSKAWLMNELG